MARIRDININGFLLPDYKKFPAVVDYYNFVESEPSCEEFSAFRGVKRKPPQPPKTTKKKPTTGEERVKNWEDCVVHYTVRSPWEWVMKEVVFTMKKEDSMFKVEKPTDLPSSRRAAAEAVAAAAASSSDLDRDRPNKRGRQRRSLRKLANIPATLNIELSNRRRGLQQTVNIHGTSSCLDGLEDRDELHRTLQRCRCEHLQLLPPTVLIGWDVSKEECFNLVGTSMPTLQSNQSSTKFAVLKEPIGSNLFYVKDADEIHDIISRHKKRTKEEPELLDRIIESKGRIPKWALQAEVNPCYLLEGNYKFHIRSYFVAVENICDEAFLEIYFYKHHEIHVARAPMVIGGENNDTTRSSAAYMTRTPSLSDIDKRRSSLLSQIPQLVQINLQSKLELFLARTFQHLQSDMARRVAQGKNKENDTSHVNHAHKFAIGSVDMMLSSDGRIYLLEVNSDPAAPSEAAVDDAFKYHLINFMKNLIDLVATGKYTYENFISMNTILQTQGEKRRHEKMSN